MEVSIAGLTVQIVEIRFDLYSPLRLEICLIHDFINSDWKPETVVDCGGRLGVKK